MASCDGKHSTPTKEQLTHAETNKKKALEKLASKHTNPNSPTQVFLI